MKRIIYYVLIHFVAVTMMAQSQTSFIVADKNGNSQMVPSLIFQQEQYGDRTSSGVRYMWDADGAARGSIEDVSYIARTNSNLATGTVEDITSKLEQLISTNKKVDAQGIAAVLKNNAVIEDAFSTDDNQSLIVKFKDNDTITAYPANLFLDPFYEEKEGGNLANVSSDAMKRLMDSRSQVRSGTRKKVAVFNYFSNQITRTTQNKMLEYMMIDLYHHGYDYEYYPYEKMTIANLRKVKSSSSDYIAVVIMSHGFVDGNNSFFAIGEEFDKCNNSADYKLFIDEYASEHNKVPLIARFWNEGFGVIGAKARYDCAVNVNTIKLNNDVILYMGSCDAYTKGNKYGTCVGWAGSNSTAQAHATLLFYNLMRGKSLADALDIRDQDSPYYEIIGREEDTWQRDLITKAWMQHQFEGQFKYRYYHDEPAPPYRFTDVPEYYRHGLCYLYADKYSGILSLNDKSVKLNIYMKDNRGYSGDLYPKEIFLKSIPLRSDASPKVYSLKKKKSETGYYGKVTIDLSENGVYCIEAANDENFANKILMRPMIFVRAKPFKENGGEGEVFYESCPDDEHPHMIDLGLPSGTKWSCCNVGAVKPDDIGGYYAWGETTEKDYYDVDNHIHYNMSSSSYKDIGSNISGTEYDVAHVKWGGEWVMPDKTTINELFRYCKVEQATENGVNGLKFTGTNGRTMFLPAGGEYYRFYHYASGECEYWSSELQTIVPDTSYYWGTDTIDKGKVSKSASRCGGRNVRAVVIPSMEYE
jgi:hypothetical protein